MIISRFLPARSICIALLIINFSLLNAVESPASNIVVKINKVQVDHLIRESNNPSIIFMTASWCGPCMKELPLLIRLFHKYGPRGLKMCGLAFEIAGPSAMQAILDQLKANFPVYLAGGEILDEYNITAIPVLFLIKNGRIVEKIIGSQSEEFLDKKIGEFLK